MSATTRVLTAHVPLDLADKVGRMAVRHEQQERRERLIREALADVDAGSVIDHQAVKAWAQSLGSAQPLPQPHPPA